MKYLLSLSIPDPNKMSRQQVLSFIQISKFDWYRRAISNENIPADSSIHFQRWHWYGDNGTTKVVTETTEMKKWSYSQINDKLTNVYTL